MFSRYNRWKRMEDHTNFTDVTLNSDVTDVNNSNTGNGVNKHGAVGTQAAPTEDHGSLEKSRGTPNGGVVRRQPSIASRIRNAMISGLEAIFYRVGVTIATNPYKTIAISVIIPLLLSIGMINFKLNEDFADLLLPPSSRIRGDRAWVEQHVQYEQRPIRLILKTDNVLTRKSMVALYNIHQKITELSVGDGQNFTSLCVRIGGNCFVDSLLALWYNDLARIDALTDQDVVDAVNTVKNNPMYFFAFNASRMLGLMERNESGAIVKAGVMHADWFIQSSIQIKPVAKLLEYAAMDLALAGDANFDTINVFTMDSYTEEFYEGVYGDIILIVYGLPVVLLYIVIALGKPNLVEHGIHLTAAAVLAVALSAGACFGIGLTAGLLFGATHQALIFLLLAVGVDDTFVIMTTWTRVNRRHKHLSIEERIGLTMQHAGVSVTVTSFSDLVAFACGISTTMPVLRSFCVYCSIGITFLFLLQSTLFPACLTLNQRRVEAAMDACLPPIQYKQYKPSSCSQKEVVRPFFKRVFAPILLSLPGKIFVIASTVGLAAVMIWSMTHINKGFELEKSLPEDSYVRHFLESQRLYFSTEGPGIQVFCGPMDYHKNAAVLDTMAKEYENSSVIMYGLVANWLDIYKKYIMFKNMLGGHIVLNSDGFPADEDEFYLEVQAFLSSSFGLPFSKYIDMTTGAKPRIKWTYFPMQQIVTYDAWKNEYIMEEVRRIADNTTANKLDGGKCFCYSIFHIFTEVIMYVDTEITRNFILAGVAIFVVTLLLIVDLRTSFFVLVCVILTMIDIIGALVIWDFYLDVNMVVLLIISIGLAVDFSAHIGYTFMTITGSRYERAVTTISQIGPAIFHGAVTTFIVFFVLIFGRSLSLFFAVFILVVVFGLFHGLCFLPVLLSMLGPEPYYNAGPDGTSDSKHKYHPNAEKDKQNSDTGLDLSAVAQNSKTNNEHIRDNVEENTGYTGTTDDKHADPAVTISTSEDWSTSHTVKL